MPRSYIYIIRKGAHSNLAMGAILHRYATDKEQFILTLNEVIALHFRFANCVVCQTKLYIHLELILLYTLH